MHWYKNSNTYKNFSCLLFIDINECEIGQSSCTQTCTNSIGSYTCSCNEGYHLDSNGYNCLGQSFVLYRTHHWIIVVLYNSCTWNYRDFKDILISLQPHYIALLLLPQILMSVRAVLHSVTKCVSILKAVTAVCATMDTYWMLTSTLVIVSHWKPLYRSNTHNLSNWTANVYNYSSQNALGYVHFFSNLQWWL